MPRTTAYEPEALPSGYRYTATELYQLRLNLAYEMLGLALNTNAGTAEAQALVRELVARLRVLCPQASSPSGSSERLPCLEDARSGRAAVALLPPEKHESEAPSDYLRR
jgi:hypothetical protein